MPVSEPEFDTLVWVYDGRSPLGYVVPGPLAKSYYAFSVLDTLLGHFKTMAEAQVAICRAPRMQAKS